MVEFGILLCLPDKKNPPKKTNFSCSFKLWLCEKKEDPRKDVVVQLQSDKLANRSKAFKMSFEQCRFGLRAVKWLFSMLKRGKKAKKIFTASTAQNLSSGGWKIYRRGDEQGTERVKEREGWVCVCAWQCMCKCLHGDVSLLCVRMGVLYSLPWQPSRLSIGKELVPGHRSPRYLYIPLLQMYVCFYSETIGSRKGTFHLLFFPASGFFLTRSPLPLFSSYLFSLFLFSHLST